MLEVFIMKYSIVTFAVILGSALSVPTGDQYPPPAGGYGSVDYPKDTGANLPYYPEPAGGYGSIKYPPGTGGDPPKSVRASDT